MTTPTDDAQGTSTRPYLIRALHDWCTDNGFTPYLAVFVDKTVQVPREYVKNNEIVLNVSFDATSQLQLGNEFIEFKARFGGVARDIAVPVDHVIAIYARENGQGMAFPVPSPAAASTADDAGTAGDEATRATSSTAVERRGAGIRLASVPDSEAADGGSDATRPEAGRGERPAVPVTEPDEPPEPQPPSAGGPRPSLRRIK